MLRMVARRQARARTMPRRSPRAASRRRSHRDVGAGAHRDARRRPRERRRVVDAVAGHRDDAPGLLQLERRPRLVLGQHLGLDVVDAELLRATASAVAARRPSASRPHALDARSAATASGVVALIGSATPTSPARRPSTATNTTVWPSRRRRSSARDRRIDAELQAHSKSGVAEQDARPSIVPRTPLPGHRLEVLDVGTGHAAASARRRSPRRADVRWPLDRLAARAQHAGFVEAFGRTT
jgi:hypothetical protein